MAKRRRKFNPEFKAQVVLEVLSGVKTGAAACREYGIGSQLLSKWKAHFLENAARIFEDGSPPHSEDKARMAELERLAGRQALEIQVLKKASSILRSHPSRNER
jgi:transposase-like protein